MVQKEGRNGKDSRCLRRIRPEDKNEPVGMRPAGNDTIFNFQGRACIAVRILSHFPFGERSIHLLPDSMICYLRIQAKQARAKCWISLSYNGIAPFTFLQNPWPLFRSALRLLAATIREPSEFPAPANPAAHRACWFAFSDGELLSGETSFPPASMCGCGSRRLQIIWVLRNANRSESLSALGFS